MKVKIFTAMNAKNKPEPVNTEFETQINEWLQQHPSIEIGR
jgi:hypothetical protein